MDSYKTQLSQLLKTQITQKNPNNSKNSIIQNSVSQLLILLRKSEHTL